jgi:ABC-2 type transport system permease protein
MILTIVRHEIKQIRHARKIWFGAAAMQFMLALIFNWLLSGFLKNQTALGTAHHGITEDVIRPFYACFALMYLICIPMLTTQVLCAEKQRHTFCNYYCAPISNLQIMLGKFLSLNIILSAILGIISCMPLMLAVSGQLDWGQLFAIILGVYGMLNVALAIGLCVASFMHNIVRCNLFVLLTLVAFIMLEWAAQYMGQHALFWQNFALLRPLKAFLNGVLNAQAVAYYLFIITGALFIGAWRLSYRGIND